VENLKVSEQYLECTPPNENDTIDVPIFMVDVKTKEKKVGSRTNLEVEIDITKGKPFFKGQTRKFFASTYTWAGIQDEMMPLVKNILANMLNNRVELDENGSGVIGPLTSDELVLFELAVTNANFSFNKLALEYCERRGYNVENARQVYDNICKGA